VYVVFACPVRIKSKSLLTPLLCFADPSLTTSSLICFVILPAVFLLCSHTPFPMCPRSPLTVYLLCVSLMLCQSKPNACWTRRSCTDRRNQGKTRLMLNLFCGWAFSHWPVVGIFFCRPTCRKTLCCANITIFFVIYTPFFCLFLLIWTWSDVRYPGWGLSVWSLHVLPVYACVISGYSSFLPPSKNMHVRLMGDSKLSRGVSVSVDGCVFRLSLCGPAMDWWPVQGVPCLLPNDSWDRLQPPCNSKLD